MIEIPANIDKRKAKIKKEALQHIGLDDDDRTISNMPELKIVFKEVDGEKVSIEGNKNEDGTIAYDSLFVHKL